MQNTLVSVILPTYNGSKYISKSIESILTQTYTNFELIIINDASIDNVEDIILDYQKKDNRIVYIKNDQNLERSKTKNK
jgi:glycosyltransferase involved in cell wall biosynthesis